MPSPSFAEYTEIALTVAREAAQVASRGFRTEPHAHEKRHAELVTEHDLASENWIRRRLAELTPEVGVIGEEGGGEPGAKLTWYCDPIDGTTNFVHGHPFWCVSIGLSDGERALAGAVVAPSLGLEWWGGQGLGAFRNGASCAVSRTSELHAALVATGFPSDRSSAPANNFASFTAVKRAVRGVRRCGSAAIDLCLVADGTYDAYWERALSAWDLMAGAAIGVAAGARISALDGGSPELERGHILVSNGALHDGMLALISDQP